MCLGGTASSLQFLAFRFLEPSPPVKLIRALFLKGQSRDIFSYVFYTLKLAPPRPLAYYSNVFS